MSQLHLSTGQVVANAPATERGTFIKKTYLHVAGGIVAFATIEAMVINMGIGAAFAQMLAGTSWMWLIVLALFMGVSWLAEKWAMSDVSEGIQYAGLGLYIVANAIIFSPLIYASLVMAPDGSLLQGAALITATLVAGITFTAFSSKKDFSFMGKFLMMGGFVALGLIAASILFGFELGLFFTGAMILFAGAMVLYSTSNIMHHYHASQYVAASLHLFGSISMLFWYVLQFLMAMGGDE